MATASTAVAAKRSHRAQRQRRERWLMIAAVAALVAAWFYGYFSSGVAVAPLVQQVLPGAVSVQETHGVFVARDEAGAVVGYAAAGQAPGYGGPVELLVAVAPDGQIVGVRFLQEHESPGFFRLVLNSDLLSQYGERTAADPLRLGEDLDAVSGATMSAEGVAGAVRRAVDEIAAEGLEQPRPVVEQEIQFGVPEIVLLLLFAAGYLGHRWRNGAWKRRVRWGTLVTGMVVLGFVYTMPLTISMAISLLSGYWPDWHNNLYWYLLLGGILFVTTVDAKNPYCYWFCPFGAVQECLAAVSGARFYRPSRFSNALKWMQRGLAVTAIGLGLALRRPGVAGYEPFATLFDLRGTTVAWALLVLVLLASLALYRPFCNYLCPIDPLVDFIAAGRRWGKETVTQWRRRDKSA